MRHRKQPRMLNPHFSVSIRLTPPEKPKNLTMEFYRISVNEEFFKAFGDGSKAAPPSREPGKPQPNQQPPENRSQWAIEGRMRGLRTGEFFQLKGWQWAKKAEKRRKPTMSLSD